MLRTNTQKWRLLLFLLLTYAPSTAQFYADVYLFQEQDGLPNKAVSSIVQDENGYIWVGTKAGLARFDGQDFKSYSIQDGLPGTQVFDMCRSGKGETWIATNKGIAKHKAGRFEPFVLDSLQPDLKTFSLTIDHKGNLWAGTLNGIYHFRGNHIQHFDLKEFPTIEKNYILSICTTPDSALWFGGEAMLIRHKNQQWAQIKLPTKTQQPNAAATRNRIWALVPNGRDKVIASYLGTTLSIGPNAYEEFSWPIGQKDTQFKELFYYTGHQGHLVENLLPYDNQSNLFAIHPFFEDRDGILWIGSNFGLRKLMPSAFRSFPARELSSPGVFVDTNGKTFAGRDSLFEFSQNGFFSGNAKKMNAAGIKKVQSSLLNDDTLYLGTHYDGVFIVQADNIKQIQIDSDVHKNNAFALSKDDQQRLWVGAYGKGVSIFNEADNEPLLITDQNGLPSNLVLSLLHDASGRMWIGTENGLVLFENDTINPLESQPILAHIAVYCMLQDSRKRIWLGTESGLYCLQNETELISVLSSNNGLKSPVIRSLILDDYDQIWAGTPNGIYQIPIAGYIDGTSNFRSFHESGDFKSINCTFNAVTQDVAGNIYWGLNDGVLVYDPKRDDFDSKAPLLSLEGVMLFDSLVESSGPTLSNSLQFNYKENYLTFDFIGLSHRQPDKVNYSYKLEGFDPGWSPFLPTSFATYSNLPPGDYQFQVIAQNADLISNKTPLVVNVSIAPPFWQTSWFYCLIIASLILLIYAVFKLKVFIYNKEIATELMTVLLNKIKKSETLYIKVIDGSFVHIKLNDILFLRASRNYVDIQTSHKKYVVYASLSKTLKNLPSKKFIRIHRSYAINISRVEKVCRAHIGIGQHEIPIGRSYKENMKLIKPRLIRLNKKVPKKRYVPDQLLSR